MLSMRTGTRKLSTLEKVMDSGANKHPLNLYTNLLHEKLES